MSVIVIYNDGHQSEGYSDIKEAIDAAKLKLSAAGQARTPPTEATIYQAVRTVRVETKVMVDEYVYMGACGAGGGRR